jgi:hypothetical protein
MPAEWVHNEPGPDCPCGSPTMVKVANGTPKLWCPRHWRVTGALFALPHEKPDNWPEGWPPNAHS